MNLKTVIHVWEHLDTELNRCLCYQAVIHAGDVHWLYDTVMLHMRHYATALDLYKSWKLLRTRRRPSLYEYSGPDTYFVQFGSPHEPQLLLPLVDVSWGIRRIRLAQPVPPG